MRVRSLEPQPGLVMGRQYVVLEIAYVYWLQGERPSLYFDILDPEITDSRRVEASRFVVTDGRVSRHWRARWARAANGQFVEFILSVPPLRSHEDDHKLVGEPPIDKLNTREEWALLEAEYPLQDEMPLKPDEIARLAAFFSSGWGQDRAADARPDSAVARDMLADMDPGEQAGIQRLLRQFLDAPVNEDVKASLLKSMVWRYLPDRSPIPWLADIVNELGADEVPLAGY